LRKGEVRRFRDHQAQHVGAAERPGQEPRRIRIGGLCVDVGSRRDQQSGRFTMISLDGNQERRTPCPVDGVERYSRRDQPPQRRAVTLLRRDQQLPSGRGRAVHVAGRDRG
jgi:hypothetical protein